MEREFRTSVATMRAWLAAHNHLQGHVRVIVTPFAVHLENATLEGPGSPGESHEGFVRRLDRGELDYAAMDAAVASEMKVDTF